MLLPEMNIKATEKDQITTHGMKSSKTRPIADAKSI
jgi:hypothetical protein